MKIKKHIPVVTTTSSIIFSPVYALDAKMRFDDNAEFRQKEIFDERDWSQEDAKEVEASRYNLNYIALDGKYYMVYYSKQRYQISLLS